MKHDPRFRTLALGIILSAGTTVLPAQETVIIPCDGDTVFGSYCYTDNDQQTWHWQSACGGAITIQFVSGTIESSYSDHLGIYDGPEDMSVPIYANPVTPDLQDLAGLALVGNSGHLYMKMSSNATNCCATSGLVATGWEPWMWMVYHPGGMGTTEPQAGGFRLYPNPAVGKVYVEWPRYMVGDVQVRLVDASGRIVLRDSFAAASADRGDLSLEGIRDGLYTVVMSGPEGLVARRLLVAR